MSGRRPPETPRNQRRIDAAHRDYPSTRLASDPASERMWRAHWLRYPIALDVMLDNMGVAFWGKASRRHITRPDMPGLSHQSKPVLGRRRGRVSQADRRLIRRAYAAGGTTQEALGRLYGLTQRNISSIVRGREKDR